MQLSDTNSDIQKLSPAAIRDFQETIYRYYLKHKRDFPWRSTDNQYFILVSEIMLQQTQVERVIEKYKKFISIFPDFSTLARANLKEVFTVWHGLGYNRRALSLLNIAQTVMTRYGGNLPVTVEELEALPGIGKATAGAILAFAFNIPVVLIETNIRRVFIHHFFHNSGSIKDRDILLFIEQTLDRAHPRKWYYALMDYGSMLKRQGENPNRRSAGYRQQSPFEGSDRKIRGRLLELLIGLTMPEKAIVQKMGADPERVKKILVQLKKEGLIREEEGKYFIP